MNKESFVFYESVFRQVERLENKFGKEAAYDYIKAVCEFGLYAAVPKEDDDVWLYGLEQTFTSITAAKDRRLAAIENGKKGGRPKVNINQEEALAKKAELKTWKAVAQHYGVSEETLRQIRKEWENPKNPKNLNENENVNVNVNENDNDNVVSSASQEEIGALPQTPSKEEAVRRVMLDCTGENRKFKF